MTVSAATWVSQFDDESAASRGRQAVIERYLISLLSPETVVTTTGDLKTEWGATGRSLDLTYKGTTISPENLTGKRIFCRLMMQDDVQ